MESRPIYSDADFSAELCWCSAPEASSVADENSPNHATVRLILRGTLLQDQARILSGILKTLLSSSAKQIRIDLSGVHAISHRAIRVLLSFTKKCEQQGKTWSCAPLNETLQLVFQEMGLFDYFLNKARS
ncbi:MAG: STAS domain-containing protein [candidate division KSB1 bacterium]|nr:STAS domain-containing protein [candidate division KSB1 bacterium]MDQ7064205.1 STAS domain-containing protein [candidate division KSB1 bacterium]